MPRLNFKYTLVNTTGNDGKPHQHYSLSKEDFDSFNSTSLGLGDVAKEGKYVQALAAFYDLEGFTSFCNQVDSHLVIPEFLKQFIDWLFLSLAREAKQSEQEGRIVTWGTLPFYIKFLGDGILFLWDTDLSHHPTDIGNIVTNLYLVARGYQGDFLPDARRHFSHPPSRLRCGVARGQIITVGNGEDYVGSCINIAARLQKLSQLTFAVSRRGIDLGRAWTTADFGKLALKAVDLRGIGPGELVYVAAKEFEDLPFAEKKLFKEP
jgi:class 3 adenylate cyclase